MVERSFVGKYLPYSLLGLVAAWAFLAKRAGPSRPAWSQGPQLHLVSFAVKGASRPGSRCKVQLHGPPDFWVSLAPTPCRWAQGDRIELSRESLDGLAKNPAKARRGLWVSHYIGHRRQRSGFWASLANWRSWLFVACSSDPGANFVLASLSGMPNVLRKTRLSWLRDAGLGHLTAVSGLHVGTLAQVVGWASLRMMGLGRVPNFARFGVDIRQVAAILLSTVPLIAFVLATGAAASASRAFLCWVTFSLTAACGLNLHRLIALGAIAVLMLACRPSWWGEPGFCFSFVATAVLLWPQRALEEVAESEERAARLGSWHRFKQWLAQSSWSTSWQLCWALAPLSLWFFEKASLVSVFANLVAIPVFAMWVLPIGLLALALAGLSSALGCAWQAQDLVVDLFTVAGYGGSLVLETARLASAFPQGTPWHWSILSAWALVFYPTRKPVSPLHPLAFAPRTLLWVLLGAPLWSPRV